MPIVGNWWRRRGGRWIVGRIEQREDVGHWVWILCLEATVPITFCKVETGDFWVEFLASNLGGPHEKRGFVGGTEISLRNL